MQGRRVAGCHVPLAVGCDSGGPAAAGSIGDKLRLPTRALMAAFFSLSLGQLLRPGDSVERARESAGSAEPATMSLCLKEIFRIVGPSRRTQRARTE